MKKIQIVSCTKDTGYKVNQSKIYQSHQKFSDQADLRIVAGNNKKLAEVYNYYMHDDSGHEIKIFCHDDVYIDDLKLEEKLERAFISYDVVGLAGCINPKIAHPALWHIMGGSVGNLRGTVYHNIPYTTEQDKIGIHEEAVMATTFGPTPSRVVLLDGLFIAVNIKKIKEKGIRFDESNPCIAHHYDLDFSLQCHKNKLRLGVWPIHVVHMSPGLSSLDDAHWKKSNEWFLNKWQSK